VEKANFIRNNFCMVYKKLFGWIPFLNKEWTYNMI